MVKTRKEILGGRISISNYLEVGMTENRKIFLYIAIKKYLHMTVMLRA